MCLTSGNATRRNVALSQDAGRGEAADALAQGMIALSPEAEAPRDALIAHYEALGRIETSLNLLNALEQARD